MSGQNSNFLDKNVRSIYNIIKQPGKYTRTEISEITGISLTTVTKIVDLFVAKGMVRLQYTKNKLQGRRVKYVSLHPERYIVVYDFTTPKFKTLVVNLCGKLKQSFLAPNLLYAPYRMIDEEINIHIKDTEYYISTHYKRFHCIGVVYLMPGHFDTDTMKVVSPRFPQINRIDFTNVIEKNNLSSNIVFCDIRECYMQKVADDLSSDESGLVIFVDSNNISSGQVMGKLTVTKPNYAPFGKAIIRDGHTLESISKYIEDPNAVASIIAEEVCNISKRVPVDNLFVFGNKYPDMTTFTRSIQNELDILAPNHPDYLPKVRCDFENNVYLSEIAAKIRDKRYMN